MPDSNDPTRPDFSDLTARVYRLCLAMLGDRAEAEEAAQEALTRAWSRRNARRDGVPWWTFAAGFAVRVCREARRDRRKRWRGELEEAGLETGSSRGLKPAAWDGDASRGLKPAARGGEDDDRWRIGGMLHRAIAALPPRQREVVVLRFLMSMSTETAAEALGVPAGTVKSNLHKAVANLRGALGSNGDVTAHELLGLRRTVD